MADSPWQYDARPSVRRFRDTRTGRFLAASKAIDIRDGFVERRRADAEALTRQLADQSITVQEWERQMTEAIRQLHTAQYALGRGGLNAMTPADWDAAAALVEEQRRYLRDFARDVAAGNLSEAQIAARAKLYYGSSVAAYERGRASAFGVALPAYPGDGSTVCKSSCRCYWQLAEKDDTVEATWKRSASESCSTCKTRAAAWSPLAIARPARGRIAQLLRVVA